MHTLHEFFIATKGTEYLIAITFLVVFPIFWFFLNQKKKTVNQKAKKDRHESQRWVLNPKPKTRRREIYGN